MSPQNLLENSTGLVTSYQKQELGETCLPILFPSLPLSHCVLQTLPFFLSFNHANLFPASRHYIYYSFPGHFSQNPIFSWLPTSCYQTRTHILPSVPHATCAGMHLSVHTHNPKAFTHYSLHGHCSLHYVSSLDESSNHPLCPMYCVCMYTHTHTQNESFSSQYLYLDESILSVLIYCMSPSVRTNFMQSSNLSYPLLIFQCSDRIYLEWELNEHLFNECSLLTRQRTELYAQIFRKCLTIIS